MMKKLISMVMILVLAFSLTACGGEGQPADRGNSQPSAVQDDTPRTDVKVLTGFDRVDGDGYVNIHRRFSLADQRLMTTADIQHNSYEIDVTLSYDEGAKTAVITAVCEAFSNGSETITIQWDDRGRLAAMFEESRGYVLKTVYTYDEAGNCISEVEYKDDEINGTTTYLYDDHGNEVSCTHEYGDRITKYEYDHAYDDEGNITCTRYLENGEEYKKSEFTYDANGNMASRQNYDDEGIKSGYFEYEYDADGRMLKEHKFNSWGEPSSTTQYTYDDDGNLLQKTTVGVDGELRETITNTYETAHMSEVEFAVYQILLEYAGNWS